MKLTRLILPFFIGLIWLGATSVVYADTITVNSNGDDIFVNTGCTLREAITNANDDASTYPECAKGAGTDVINFSLSSGNTIGLGSSLPSIQEDLMIDGSGVSGLTIVILSGTVFKIDTGHVTLNKLKVTDVNLFDSVGVSIEGSASVTLTNVLITNHQNNSCGAGIKNKGWLLVQSSNITGNVAGNSERGGGICNEGGATLILENSTLNDNKTSSMGGAIYNEGTVMMTASTLKYNAANAGGGIYNKGDLVMSQSSILTNYALTGVVSEGGAGIFHSEGVLVITNSTLSNNRTNHSGGAIYIKENSSKTYLNYVTVFSNAADVNMSGGGDAGGIYVKGGDVYLQNTIVAQNKDFSPDTQILDGRGTFIDMGHNLIGAVDNSTGFVASTTLTGTVAAPLNPELAPLQNQGGATLILPLLPHSPAIDNGDDTNSPATDQRGQPRIQGAASDIGAYESALTSTTTSIVQFSQAITYQVQESGVMLGAAIAVTRTGVGLAVVQVLTHSGGTATAGVDYVDTPLIITFTGNLTYQEISLPITQDAIMEPLETIILSIVPVSHALTGTMDTATVAVFDDDLAGVSAFPVKDLWTSEYTTTATFAISLTSQPMTTVTLAITSSHLLEGLPEPNVITFTPVDWFMPQTITVTGQDDSLADGNITYTLQITALSGDPFYNTLPTLPEVTLTNIDNDQPFITVSPTSGLTTTEWGGNTYFSMRLNTMPTATVTITLLSSNPVEGTVSPTVVLFDSTNWAIPQVITVYGGNGWVDDGDRVYTIETQPAISDDPLYQGLDPADVVLVNLDDEVAGMVITPTSGLVTTEGGGMAVFSITLTSQPIHEVVITLTSSDLTEGWPTPSVITFMTGLVDWQIPRFITVTGQDDAWVDGTKTYTIVTGPATSLDLDYHGLDITDVVLINLDNDIPPNIAPVANNDSFTLTEDIPTVLPIRANDFDPDGFIVMNTLNNPPSHGQIALNLDGTVTYTPALNFNGSDMFSYQVKDNMDRASNLAWVSLTILPANDPPTVTQIIPDSIITEDEAFQLSLSPLSFYDLDDGDKLSYTAQLSGAVALPAWLQFNAATQTFTGLADNEAVGDWPIQVTATDLGQLKISQTFTLTVLNVNDAPFTLMALPAQVVMEDQPFQFVMGSHVFSDVDRGDILTYTVSLSNGLPLPSWLVFNPDTQTFTGIATNAEVGTWELKLIAKDKSLASTRAAFTLTVINVNQPPLAQADIATTLEETPVIITVLANDSDPDKGDGITLTQVSVPLYGAAVISGAAILYTPPSQFNGVVTFTYQIKDSGGLTSTARVTLLVGNQAEIGRPDEATTFEDTPVMVKVLANDTNVGQGQQGLSLLAVGVPLHGQTVVSGSQVVYQPAVDFYGLDTFVYIVTNGEVADLETVTITVIAVNDGVVARDDVATTAENIPITLHVLANDSDPDNSPLTLQAASAPQHGVIELGDNVIIYTPAPDFRGVDSLSYIVTDGVFTATAQVTVEVVAVKPPVALDDTYQLLLGQAITLPILLNDYDPYNFPLQLIKVGTPRHGQVVRHDHVIVYTPFPDFTGTDYFEYELSNGNLTDMAMVWLQIVPPDPITPPLPITLTSGLTVTFPLTWPQTTVLTAPLHGQVVISQGEVIYWPDEGFVGTETITLTVSDGTVTKTVVIEVVVATDTMAPTGVILLEPIQAAVLTTLRPTLTWQAATDNVGVVSYTLTITPFNQPPLIITTPMTSYNLLADLPPGPYQWSVTAHDAAGNISRPATPETFILKPPMVWRSFLPFLQGRR